MRRTRVVGQGGAKARARARRRAVRPGRPEASRAARQRPVLPPPRVAEHARRLGAAAALEDAAGALLDDPDVLDRVAEAMQANGYAGDLLPAKLAYVALTSRVLQRPMNLAFVAEAATGKNATVDAARALVPDEEVYVFSAGSPRALLYTEKDFRHRVVIFTDADGIPQNTAAAAAVCALAEGNALSYAVTTLNRGTGQFATQTITRPGPTGLITTSTRPLRPPLTTRLLQVPVAGDAEATREVILRQGKEAAGETPPRPDLKPFLALQRWLADVGRHPVIVPFGETLAEAMPSTFEARMRRDFRQLLSAVQTLALLRQQHRDPGRGGAIIASFDDYRVARELLEVSFYVAAAEGLTPAVRETVAAVRGAKAPPSEADLARELRVTRQAIWGRLRTPLAKRWIVNAEAVPGRPARLRCDRPLPEVPTALPEASHVEGWFWGIPHPACDEVFLKFAAAMAAEWAAGITAAEAAAQVQRDPEVVRARLDTLATQGYLHHDAATDRYNIVDWVRDLLAWRAELREPEQAPSEPPSTEPSEARREGDGAPERAPAPSGTDNPQPAPVGTADGTPQQDDRPPDQAPAPHAIDNPDTVGTAEGAPRQASAGQEDDRRQEQAPVPHEREDRPEEVVGATEGGRPREFARQEDHRRREQPPRLHGTDDQQPGAGGTADRGRLDDE